MGVRPFSPPRMPRGPGPTPAARRPLPPSSSAAAAAGGGVSHNTEGCGGGGRGGSYVRVTITKGAESTLDITVGALGAARRLGRRRGQQRRLLSIVQGATTHRARAGRGRRWRRHDERRPLPAATTENGTEVHTGGVYFGGGNGGDGNLDDNISGGGGGAAGPRVRAARQRQHRRHARHGHLGRRQHDAQHGGRGGHRHDGGAGQRGQQLRRRRQRRLCARLGEPGGRRGRRRHRRPHLGRSRSRRRSRRKPCTSAEAAAKFISATASLGAVDSLTPPTLTGGGSRLDPVVVAETLHISETRVVS